MPKANKFLENDNAELGGAMGDLLLGVVVVFILAIFAAALAPTAITTITNTSTNGWGTDVVSIWDVLPVIVAVVILLLFVSVILILVKRYA